jgi:hypothetical protein
VAVRTEKPEIVGPVVPVLAVDVVDMQRDRLGAPDALVSTDDTQVVPTKREKGLPELFAIDPWRTWRAENKKFSG